MTLRRPALLPLLLALAAPAALAGCGEGGRWPEKGVRVVVTAPALGSLARKVVGGHGTVRCLCEGPENGVEEFEPSSGDAALLRRADFLFANGLGLDDAFTEELRVNAANPKLRYVALGDLVPEGDRLKEPGGAVDPHVWMGLTQAKAMVNGVRDRLKEHDPDNAGDYDANAEAHTKELSDILSGGREALSKVREKDRKLVALHDPVRYLAADLGVTVAGAVETPPGEAPNEARYNEIAALCKKEHVRLLALPKPLPEKAINDGKDELKKRGVPDVEVVVIDPLETADGPTTPDWYKEKMQANIDALVKALTK
jgi:ABC-type Zn uptake system ZnuABC Zn-binding protein ZnuA